MNVCHGVFLSSDQLEASQRLPALCKEIGVRPLGTADEMDVKFEVLQTGAVIGQDIKGFIFQIEDDG